MFRLCVVNILVLVGALMLLLYEICVLIPPLAYFDRHDYFRSPELLQLTFQLIHKRRDEACGA